MSRMTRVGCGGGDGRDAGGGVGGEGGGNAIVGVPHVPQTLGQDSRRCCCCAAV